MKVSMVIPAYNEEQRIGKTLENYHNFFKNKKEINTKILVVINNTKDNTEKIVREYSKKYKEISYLNFKEGGKGFAIREGFKHSLKEDFDLIGFVDADMASPPEAIYDLIKSIDSYDGIIANRYDKKSVVSPRQTWKRRLASRVFNFIVKTLFLFNFNDTQCGAKFFKKHAVEKIINGLSMSQWAVDIDLLYNAKKHGFRIKERHTIWRDIGDSKINLKKSSFQMLLAVLQLRVLNSKLKKFWKFFKPFTGALYHFIR